MDTTYVDRSNTNEKVFKTTSEKLAQEGVKKKTITTFIEAYRKQKRKRACIIIQQPGTPIYKVSFRGES